MKLFGHIVAPMYSWSIGLLVLIAAISSVILKQVPYALIFAVIICSVLEIAIRAIYLKHKFKMPSSGVITGLIIGLVAPINASLVPIALACSIAIGLKFVIKFKGTNVFNPAALGLLIGLGVFSLGSSWWATTAVNFYGAAISLSVILIIAAYKARRLALALSFIVAITLIGFFANPLLNFSNFEVALLGVNFFFAFIMITDPKTSPIKQLPQVVYGVFVAVIYYLLLVFAPQTAFWAQSLIFISLLIANLVYALCRHHGHKVISHIRHRHHNATAVA